MARRRLPPDDAVEDKDGAHKDIFSENEPTRPASVRQGLSVVGLGDSSDVAVVPAAHDVYQSGDSLIGRVELEDGEAVSGYIMVLPIWSPWKISCMASRVAISVGVANSPRVPMIALVPRRFCAPEPAGRAGPLLPSHRSR